MSKKRKNKIIKVILKIIKEALIILGIIMIVGIVLTFKPTEKPKTTEEEIAYTTFLQMVNENKIDSIEMRESSSTIRGFNESDSGHIYITKAPNTDVLTEYLQEKIIDGCNINIIVKENESFNYLSFILSLILFALIGFMFFALVKIIKQAKNMMNSDIMTGELISNKVGSEENELENPTKSSITFKDVKGLDEEINELAEIVDFLKNPDKYRTLGAKIPKGVLLDGEPGTGKTLLAKAIAGEADISFISTSGSEFIEKYVGVGASRIRNVFKKARENAPCIIFIDEIDAIGAKREENGGFVEHNQTLEQLLAEMDGFTERTNIIVIAATNRLSSLDPALIRPGRFDRKITIHLPDRKGREEILKLYAENKPIDESVVDFSNIAYNTAGFSGAALENLLNEAALIAARKSLSSISNEEITEAMMKIQLGLKKDGRIISEKEKRLTAVHEAGHAVVSLFLETQSNLKEVCIIPRGSAGGYTLHDTIEDKDYITKTELLEELICLMGGKAAESVVLGDISTGPSNDLKVATEIVCEMISYYGMDDEIGPISFAGIYDTDLDFLSGEILGDIGSKVSEMLKKAEDDAIKLIKEHRILLDEIVEKLLEQETISGEEIETMYKSYIK